MNDLQRLILRQIAREGPLPFSEFMSLALYHPEHGYYAHHAPGAGAGYRTSPTITPWFGRMLLRAFHLMWRRLGEPQEFTVAEIGGGSGALAEAALAEAAGEGDAFSRALRWLFVEPFPEVKLRQEGRVEEFAGQTAWASSLAEVDLATGCVIANEVLDNFPVRVFEVAKGGAVEVCVGADGEKLAEVLVPLDDPGPIGLGAEALPFLEEGDRFEVSTEIQGWCAGAAACIERGYLLVIDYGDVRPGIWTNRPQGSLVTYEGEALGFDALAGPGGRDITAHVDFTSLESSARASGLQTSPVVTQRDFLTGLGIDEVTAELRKARLEADEAGDHGAALSLLAEAGRLSLLTARGGMGDFLVLIGAKDAPELFDAR